MTTFITFFQGSDQIYSSGAGILECCSDFVKLVKANILNVWVGTPVVTNQGKQHFAKLWARHQERLE